MKKTWAFIIGMISFCGLAFSSEPKQPDLGALRAIATEISNAMQRQEYEKVLVYDFPELQEEHRRDLQNKSSDLYCYLVGEDCQAATKYHSIRSQFASMKKPDVAIKHLSGVTYLVIFFDGAKYEKADVVRTSFLCKHTDVDVPIWTFVWTENHWKALHPVFNAETDPFCSGPYGI